MTDFKKGINKVTVFQKEREKRISNMVPHLIKKKKTNSRTKKIRNNYDNRY